MITLAMASLVATSGATIAGTIAVVVGGGVLATAASGGLFLVVVPGIAAVGALVGGIAYGVYRIVGARAKHKIIGRAEIRYMAFFSKKKGDLLLNNSVQPQ